MRGYDRPAREHNARDRDPHGQHPFAVAFLAQVATAGVQQVRQRDYAEQPGAMGPVDGEPSTSQ